MAKAGSKQTNQQKKVTFSLEAAEAKEVVLMGDFNNWNPKTHPMKKEKNGRWNKTVKLSPGKYEYKFLVDGNWVQDPQNNQTCLNSFGTQNNVYNLIES